MLPFPREVFCREESRSRDEQSQTAKYIGVEMGERFESVFEEMVKGIVVFLDAFLAAVPAISAEELFSARHALHDFIQVS